MQKTEKSFHRAKKQSQYLFRDAPEAEKQGTKELSGGVFPKQQPQNQAGKVAHPQVSLTDGKAKIDPSPSEAQEKQQVRNNRQLWP